MPIYPGGKVKGGNSSTNEDPRFTEMLQEAPKREVFVQDSNGEWIGTGMIMLSDDSLLAPEGFGAESGSVRFGDLINLSEASGYLAIYSYLDKSQYQMVDYHVPKDSATEKPKYIWLYEAENEFIAQPLSSTQLNANPLVFSYTTQLRSRVNSIKFKAYSAMTNVRVKITDVSAGVVLKYYPSKGSWNGESSGVDFVVGDNVVDFKDSPLLFSPGTTLQYEITADNIRILGNASGTPFLSGSLQRGEIVTLADQYDIAAIQSAMFSGNYADLTNLPSIPDSTSDLVNDSGYITSTEVPVKSVNGQTGNVTISIPAGQVNADWTATSGLAQILNKPVLFDGNYTNLTNKPTIPSNTNQLTNGSGFITAVQAATASPVQSVNGQVGAVNITVPAAQIQSDWNQSNTASVDYIKNKPTIPTVAYPVTSVNTKTGAVVLTASDVGAIATGSSIAYSSLTGTPVIPAAQVQTDWNATAGIGVLLNKPTSFTPSAHTQAWSTITATPTTLAGYGITDSVSQASLTSSLGGYATTSALTTGLSGKFNTPVGTTSQYIRGDGTLATFPTIPIVPTSVSAFANDSGYVNQVGARSSISLTTTGTSGAATYNSSTGVLNVPQYTSATPAQSVSTRALNTAFQISTTRNALVMYSVQITVTASIAGGQNGDVILEIASDSAFTTNVQTVAIAGLGQVYTLAIALQGVQPQTNVVSGFVPIGYYARLRTVNNTGTPSFSYRAGQEILL